MRKYGYCSTCNKTFTVEDRVIGKLIAVALTAILTALAGKDAIKNPLAFAGLNLTALALGHAIDTRLGLECQTPGCTTLLKIVDAALA